MVIMCVVPSGLEVNGESKQQKAEQQSEQGLHLRSLRFFTFEMQTHKLGQDPRMDSVGEYLVVRQVLREGRVESVLKGRHH